MQSRGTIPKLLRHFTEQSIKQSCCYSTRYANDRKTTGQNGVFADHCLRANDLALAGYTVSYCAGLRVPFSRRGSGFFAVAAIPAARSFAIRLMSFTGTGLMNGKWTVPFRRSRSEE